MSITCNAAVYIIIYHSSSFSSGVYGTTCTHTPFSRVPLRFKKNKRIILFFDSGFLPLAQKFHLGRQFYASFFRFF